MKILSCASMTDNDKANCLWLRRAGNLAASKASIWTHCQSPTAQIMRPGLQLCGSKSSLQSGMMLWWKKHIKSYFLWTTAQCFQPWTCCAIFTWNSCQQTHLNDTADEPRHHQEPQNPLEEKLVQSTIAAIKDKLVSSGRWRPRLLPTTSANVPSK